MNNKETSELKHFDKIADIYDVNYGYDKPYTVYKIEKKVRSFTNIINRQFGNRNIKILEIGCGTGEYTKRFAPILHNSIITAIDISGEVLKIANNKTKSANVKYVQASAYETGFKRNSYDVICSFYALHHLNLNRIANEVTSLLKPGGFLYFYEPNIFNPVVYIIKSNSKLKKLIGDSPYEWAINPTTFKKYFKRLTISSTHFSGFIPPFYFLPLGLMKIADIIFEKLDHIPILRLLGGSIEVLMKKNESR